MVISVELAYQLSSVVKLTHHETGLDWPIPINPFLLLVGRGAKEAQCRAGMGFVLAAVGITVIELECVV